MKKEINLEDFEGRDYDTIVLTDHVRVERIAERLKMTAEMFIVAFEESKKVWSAQSYDRKNKSWEYKISVKDLNVSVIAALRKEGTLVIVTIVSEDENN